MKQLQQNQIMKNIKKDIERDKTMTYRKICTYAGNDILEKLTVTEQRELDRKRRNRKKKENREAEVGAWLGSALRVGFFFFMVFGWIAGI